MDLGRLFENNAPREKLLRLEIAIWRTASDIWHTAEDDNGAIKW
jgi:hypothetical protein